MLCRQARSGFLLVLLFEAYCCSKSYTFITSLRDALEAGAHRSASCTALRSVLLSEVLHMRAVITAYFEGRARTGRPVALLFEVYCLLKSYACVT